MSSEQARALSPGPTATLFQAPFFALVAALLFWPSLTGRLAAQTWTNTSLSAYQRADALVSALTLSEKIALV